MTFDLISRNRKDNVYNPNCLNRRMRNLIPIEECLKELNGEILKNIREDYKKGNSLNEIIQHHKTKNPEALSKILDLIKFEYDEQKRFLKTYEGIEEVNIFFYPLTEENHSSIIVATLKGMKEGVQDFLNRENLITVYSPKLSYFCFDDTLKDSIEKNVGSLDLKLRRKDVPGYAEDIRGRYCSFLVNESTDRFNKRFNPK